VNFIQVRLMRPFPVAGVAAALRNAKRLVLVENNYSGQLGQVIRAETGIDIADGILKYDGRPFSEEDVVRGLKRALAGTRGMQRLATEGPQGMDVDMPAEAHA
jgi:2-oxoglutarate ferredoxin oxidoreductase subunit alpha